MEPHIIKAKSLLEEGRINWASPLIEKLEKDRKHTAIEWVVQIVRNIINESSPENQKNYLLWLNELEEIVDQQHYDVQYLEEKGRRIFSPPQGRTIYSVIISRLFGAEGFYRLEKYGHYIRFLWDILDQLSEKLITEKSSMALIIIDRFPK